MITYVNNVNASQYRILYEKATRDLMAHDENNALISPSQIGTTGTYPLITPILLTQEQLATDYQPSMYYRWKEDKQAYVLAEESRPESGVDYYTCNDITSLNEYFSFIKNLAEIDPLYTMLPLDEDTFNIDLNSRKIEIPAHFATNGISVQGDEISEVLYFKVNRFFDAQDLAYDISKNDDENRERMRIYIQWRSAQAGEDGKLIEGVSVPWVVDLTTYPNYILFGWPVSSKVTGAAGKIDFAIRFFKFQEGKVTYSLSTLTHSLEIRPSLDFNIAERLIDNYQHTGASDLVLDDNTLLIRNRLQNSEVIEGGVSAGKPYFYMTKNVGHDGVIYETAIDSSVGDNEDHNNGIIDGIQTSEGVVKEFWMNRSSRGILENDIQFKVQGGGDGRVSYEWHKLDLNQMGQEIYPENKFIATDDTEVQIGKLYYRQIPNPNDPEKPGYTPVLNPIFDTEDPSYETLYERYSVITIDSVGYYYVTIYNRVQNSLARKDSMYMVVSRPLAPVNNVPLPERGQLLANNDYQLMLVTDASVPEKDQGKGALTYQWYYARTNVGLENAEPIEGATESHYTIHGSANAEPGHAEGDGFYYVLITNNMNKETESIHGNVEGVRVTHAPVTPVVGVDTSNSKQSWNLDEVEHHPIGLKVAWSIDPNAGQDFRPEYGDAVTYQWYRYHAGPGSQGADDDRQKAERHEYVFNGDDLIEGATSESFKPNLGGYWYYCIVKNTYNGDYREGYSPFFWVGNN